MSRVTSAAKACAQLILVKVQEQRGDAHPLLAHQDSTGSTSSNASTGGLKSCGEEIGEVEKKKLEADYKTEMQDLQFAESERFPQFHYQDKLNAGMNAGNRQRTRRLGTEQADLPHSLPCSWDATVWVRRLEDRMDALQFMISGPVDTPYMNGLFLFDTYFPENYPNGPPLVNLATTGKGSVRFNPNLYNNGKVCLSLLGTWSGQQGESWSAGTSTFLQVLLSIQSLIMIEHPYFNEPGYERGTTAATESSFHYNAVIMTACIKEAMIDQIRNPKAGFEEVTRKHFKMKRSAIIAQIEGWCQLLLNHGDGAADAEGGRRSYAPKQDLVKKEREMRGLLETFTSITAEL
jgi:ubiquitin-protein ligase